jgi:hypothetical protein
MPLRLRHRMSILGSTLCSLLALMACSPKERAFSGTGGTGGAGTGGMGTGTGGGSVGGGTTGVGGTNPCATVDPDCECVDGKVVARDVDGDKEGSRLCEAAPGIDCDDGDPAFVKNECDGCNKVIGGKVGDKCGTCGQLQCQGDSALQCGAPTPTTRRCSTDKQIQLCSPAGEWVNEKSCSGALPACDGGACVQCVHGASKCGTAGGGAVIIRCLSTDSWEASWSTSCKPNQLCDYSSSSAKCVGMLFHPRDRDFEIPRLLREAPGSSGPVTAPGLPTRDVLDMALGFAFG